MKYGVARKAGSEVWAITISSVSAKENRERRSRNGVRMTAARTVENDNRGGILTPTAEGSSQFLPTLYKISLDPSLSFRMTIRIQSHNRTGFYRVLRTLQNDMTMKLALRKKNPALAGFFFLTQNAEITAGRKCGT